MHSFSFCSWLCVCLAASITCLDVSGLKGSSTLLILLLEQFSITSSSHPYLYPVPLLPVWPKPASLILIIYKLIHFAHTSYFLQDDHQNPEYDLWVLLEPKYDPAPSFYWWYPQWSSSCSRCASGLHLQIFARGFLSSALCISSSSSSSSWNVIFLERLACGPTQSCSLPQKHCTNAGQYLVIFVHNCQ